MKTRFGNWKEKIQKSENDIELESKIVSRKHGRFKVLMANGITLIMEA